MRKTSILLVSAFAGSLSISCSRPATTPSIPPTPVKSTKPKTTIASTASSVTDYSLPPDRHVLWRIFYKNAQVTFEGDEVQVGRMQDVSGQIYQKDGVKSFRADNAEGDHSSQILTLTGHVSVYSPKEDANLKCEKLIYDAKKKLYSASGDVSLVNRRYSLTGLPAAIADSSLSQVATPDMFEAKSAK